MLKRLMINIFLCLFLSSCANIKQEELQHFNLNLSYANYSKAAINALSLAQFDTNNRSVENYYWAMQAGAILGYAGQYKSAIEILDKVEAHLKKTDLKNGAIKGFNVAVSMLGTDNLLDYNFTNSDRVMLNTLKAWDFIALHDFVNARVELNRAAERQSRAVEFFAKQIQAAGKKIKNDAGTYNDLLAQTLKSPLLKEKLKKNNIASRWSPYKNFVNPFTTYSRALLYILTSHDKADFAKARAAFSRVYALTEHRVGAAELKLTKNLLQGKDLGAGNVWVIVENGMAPYKSEIRLDLPVFLVSDNISYIGLALPKLQERRVSFKNITVNGKKVPSVANIEKIVGAEFNQLFPQILAREVMRVIVKTITQKQLNDKDPLLGSIFAINQLLTTRADLRSFFVLPSAYQVTTLTNMKKNVVSIEAGDFKEKVNLPNIDKNNYIVYIKALNKNLIPNIKVIEI